MTHHIAHRRPAMLRRITTAGALAVAALAASVLAAAVLVTMPAGATPASPPTPPAGGQFHQLAPARILDTRIGLGAPTGAVAPGGTIALTVLGHGAIPASGVSAVALHVTVTGATGAGYLTVWPAGTSRPNASSINFGSGQTVANTVLVSIGAGGVVDLFNGATGSAHFIVDVSGYTDQSGGDGRGAYGTLSPARILDTRSGIGAPKAALASGATIHLAVVGHGGVPPVNDGFGYAAAVLNVAAVAPSGPGYITVWADDAPRPATSNLSLATGQTRANLVVAAIGSGGGVRIYNGSGHPVELIADISGYFSSGLPNAQNQFAVTGPTRVLDTRAGIGGPAVPVAAHAKVTVSLGTTIPLSSAVLDLTVVGPTASGYLTAWADGSTRPGTSSLNFAAGDTISGLSFVPVSGSDKVDIYNGSNGTVEIVADEAGYVTGCC